MTKYASQITQIINKLFDKTKAGAVRWDQLADLKTYQTRQGNFLVQIKGSQSISAFGNGTVLEVSRLDGTLVSRCNSSPLQVTNALAPLSTEVQIDVITRNKLNELFTIVSDRSSDLDELLNSL